MTREQIEEITRKGFDEYNYGQDGKPPSPTGWINLTKEPNSHYDRILRHLQDYGSITSLEAFKDYGNTRLSATIFLLRKDGYKISSEKVAFRNRYGKVVYFAKYILLED